MRRPTTVPTDNCADRQLRRPTMLILDALIVYMGKQRIRITVTSFGIGFEVKVTGERRRVCQLGDTSGSFLPAGPGCPDRARLGRIVG